MPRYIDADKIRYRAIYSSTIDTHGILRTEKIDGEYVSRETIEAMLRKDASRTKRGTWLHPSKNIAKCSECGCARDIRDQFGWNFCPVCGAKMGNE